MKTVVRRLLPQALYEWLALQVQTLRRLVSYPATARVGQAADYDAYWDAKFERQAGRLNPWRRARAAALAAAVDPGARVLEVGCGDGALLQYLIEQRGVRGVGVDIAPKAVACCRERGLDVRLADARQPLTAVVDGRFDYAVLSEVLEHLPDPEALLGELRELVDRALLVTIPNTGYWTHRARLLLGRFPLQWVVSPGEHLRFWTATDFRWWAHQLDFEIRAAVPYVGVRGLRRLWPALFAAGYVWVLVDRRPAERTADDAV